MRPIQLKESRLRPADCGGQARILFMSEKKLGDEHICLDNLTNMFYAFYRSTRWNFFIIEHRVSVLIIRVCLRKSASCFNR